MELLILLQFLLFNMIFIIPGGITLEPSFDVSMVNVTVKEGTTAILPCSVKFLGKHKVIWTDEWSTLLTYKDMIMIDDERISVQRPLTKDWNLHIRHVKYGDQGNYNCQINTNPVKKRTVNLKVQDYTAHRSTTPVTTPALIPTTVSTKIVTLYPHATMGTSRPVHAGKSFSASKSTNHKLCIGNLLPLYTFFASFNG